MWRLAVKNTWANRRRFGLTAIAVVLSVGFLVATLILSDSMTGTSAADIRRAHRNVDLAVEGATITTGEGGPGEFAPTIRQPISPAVLGGIDSIPGVTSTAPIVLGFAKLVANGRAIGGSTVGDIGRNWIDDEALSPFELVDGAAPTNATDVVLDRATAVDADVAVGDQVDVLSVVGIRSMTVTGIATFGGAERAPLQRTVLFAPSAASAALGGVGVTQLLVGVDDSASPDTVMSSIDALAADDVVRSGTSYISEQQRLVAAPLDVLSLFLVSFAVIATLVGITIIYNTFALALAQRRRELALMRAVGATRRQVLTAVMAESLLIGVLGTAVGLGLGLLGAQSLERLMSGIGIAFLDGPLVIASRTIIIGIAVGMLVTLLSAWAPARRVSTVAPVEALREAAAEANRVPRWRTIGGVVATLAGVGCLIGSALATNSLLLIGGAVVIPGIVMVGPALVDPAARVARPLLQRFGNVEGSIASTNLSRNPRRSASTALALTLGVAMVAFFVTLASTLTAGLADDATKALRADAVVTSVTPDFATVDPTLSTRLSAIDGVSVVAPTNRAEAKIDDGGARVGGIDPAAMAKTFDFGVTDGSLEPLVDGGIAVRTDGNVDDPKVGDSLVVQFTDAEVTLPVVATFSTTFVGFDAPTHLMDRRQLAAVTSGLLDVSIYLGLDPSIVGTADRDRVLAAVQDAVAATPGSLFETEKSFIAKSGDEIKGFRNFIYAMLGLCVLVALVGIANTMKLAIAERTHELGLLRAVGTTRRSVRRLVRLEAGLLAAVGSVVGVLVGSLLAWALLTVDGNARFGTVTWPIGTLVAVAIASVVAGVIAAARPAWVAAKVPVLDAIARR